MFNHWLRHNKWAAGVLTILRIYLGWEFLNAGWGKITSSKPFTAAGFLANSIHHPVLGPTKSVVYPIFISFLKNFALPHVGVFNVLVPWGEFLVGLGLILGTLTTAAVFFGILMNFMYMFAGTISTNPIDVLIGAIILSAGFNAGKIGGDSWVIPWIHTQAKRLMHKEIRFRHSGQKTARH